MYRLFFLVFLMLAVASSGFNLRFIAKESDVSEHQDERKLGGKDKKDKPKKPKKDKNQVAGSDPCGTAASILCFFGPCPADGWSCAVASGEGKSDECDIDQEELRLAKGAGTDTSECEEADDCCGSEGCAAASDPPIKCHFHQAKTVCSNGDACKGSCPGAPCIQDKD